MEESRVVQMPASMMSDSEVVKVNDEVGSNMKDVILGKMRANVAPAAVISGVVGITQGIIPRENE